MHVQRGKKDMYPMKNCMHAENKDIYVTIESHKDNEYMYSTNKYMSRTNKNMHKGNRGVHATSKYMYTAQKQRTKTYTFQTNTKVTYVN